MDVILLSIAGIAGIVGVVLAANGLYLIYCRLSKPQGRGRPAPVMEFTGLWVDGDRIVAEGASTAATTQYERGTIVANGRVIEMMVVEIDFGGRSGPHWHAQDVKSLRAAHWVAP
jgi:hypothetical protein